MTDSDSTGNSDYDSGSTESKPNWRRELENRAKKAEDSQAELATKLENYERRIRATKNEDELKALMESQGFGWNASV